MRRGLMIGLMVLISLFSIAYASAEGCQLVVTLLNQDPYPAVQGEYVKIVFQINGLANVNCKNVEFELLEKYPISIDASDTHIKYISAGTFSKDYSSFALVPYKIRISDDALDGDNSIEVKYKYGDNINYETKEFKVNVKDTRADFEISIKDYDYATKMLTFQVLNLGEEDIQALTLEIPKQDNIIVKGSNRNIIGDLDSNEYTTAEFEAYPENGDLKVDIYYTDKVGARRMLEKAVVFDDTYFQGIASRQNTTSIWTYVFWLVVVGLIAYYFYRRHKKKHQKK